MFVRLRKKKWKELTIDDSNLSDIKIPYFTSLQEIETTRPPEEGIAPCTIQRPYFKIKPTESRNENSPPWIHHLKCHAFFFFFFFFDNSMAFKFLQNNWAKNERTNRPKLH